MLVRVIYVKETYEAVDTWINSMCQRLFLYPFLKKTVSKTRVISLIYYFLKMKNPLRCTFLDTLPACLDRNVCFAPGIFLWQKNMQKNL